jgi:hypothetical protein
MIKYGRWKRREGEIAWHSHKNLIMYDYEYFLFFSNNKIIKRTNEEVVDCYDIKIRYGE